MDKIRKGRFAPLIIILILICVVPAIMLVGATIGRPQETAELNKNVEQQEEQISAETTTVQAGDTYTVPKTGLYKIELHGGKAADFVTSLGSAPGWKGAKVTGYVKLSKDESLVTIPLIAGMGLDGTPTGLGAAGKSIAVRWSSGSLFACGGPGRKVRFFNGEVCDNCLTPFTVSDEFRFQPDGLFPVESVDWENWDRTPKDAHIFRSSVEYGYVSCPYCSAEVLSTYVTAVESGGIWGEEYGYYYVEMNSVPESVKNYEFDKGGSLATSHEPFMTVTPIEHELTIYPAGGTWNGGLTSSSITVGEGATIDIANPTRTGYNFTGWTVTPNNVGSSISGTTFTMGSADTTLTANWTPAQYTVTVNKGTGIESVTGAGTYTYGGQVTVTATPSTNTAQYTYGWSNWTGSGIAGSNSQSYTFTMPAGNVTLTANGTQTTNSYLQTVRIRYQNADGTYGAYSNVINQNYNYGATVSWNTGQISGFDTNTYQSASLTSYQVTGAKTTDMDINRKTYALTVNKGTGIASVTGANTYRVGQSVTVTATPATGYTWANWTVGAPFVGMPEGNDTTVPEMTFTMPSQNVIYTANATTNTYTITYDLAGGNVTENPTNYTVETENFTLNNPIKAEYDFIGWTGANGGAPQKEVTIAKGSIGDKEYTANWTPIEYNIEYTLNEGTNAPENPEKYTIETNTITLADPTRTGYTFAGWTGSNGTTPQTTVTINKGSTGNKNYTANWTKDGYTINYELNGGTVTGNPTTYTIESENITLKNPKRVGYTFAGWTGSNGETPQLEVTINKGSAGNKNYIANWTKDGYTINYELNGGTVTGNPATYTIESENITLKNPTRVGYTFVGWTGSNGETPQLEVTINKGSTGNKNYIANWTQSTNTPYIVQHWQQNLVGAGIASAQDEQNENNYTLVDTDVLEGTTGTKVIPNVKQYLGFIAPEPEEVEILEDGSLVVDYYYQRRTDLRYTVKYIDKDEGTVIDEKTIEDQTFENEININNEIKNIEGYNFDSIEPETLKIGVGENIINIYYIKKEGRVIAHHYIYDEENNKYLNVKLVEDEEIAGKIGENYTTNVSNKIPANYECINNKPEEYTGIITQIPIEIIYYYKLKTPKTEGKGSCNIITELERDKNGNYIIKAGEKVEYEVIYETKIDDYIGKATIEIKAELPKGTKIDLSKSDLAGGKYDESTNTITWIKEIENIDTFANGPYTEKLTQYVKIVYAKDYVLKDANLRVTGNIITYYPDNYPEKGGQVLPNQYKDNSSDQNDQIDGRQGKVIVEYVDIDEPENGAYRYEINDIIGKEYKTEEKEIPYYVLVRNTENTKGKIKEETQTVTYYYRKQDFNIGIEKTIGWLSLNGQNIGISDKETAKIELKKDEIKKTELIVKYNIKVTNKGELGGTSKVLELIPEGYELEYIPEYWNIMGDGNLETSVNLEAGESKELEVVLRWENKEENLGTRTTTVKIEETENSANFKETNEEDNIGTATIVVGIKTGETVSIIIIGMIIITAIISIYITYSKITYKKGPSIKNIKFLNR